MTCRNCGAAIERDQWSITGWVHSNRLVQCALGYEMKAQPTESDDE